MVPDRSPLRLITQKDVLRLACIGSRETLSRWIRRGLFPPPIHVGGGQLRWVSAEVEAWLEERKAERIQRRSMPADGARTRASSTQGTIAGPNHA